jgi:DNA-binding NarL/FixJ family response regulator
MFVFQDDTTDSNGETNMHRGGKSHMYSKQPIRILIVEDDAITAAAIERSLRDMDYDVTGTADSGSEAIAMAIDTEPDLVLMDIRLKGPMDGISATQRIWTLLQIPVVYLTAHSDRETLKRALHSKAHGFITKPYHAGELNLAIQQAVERAPRRCLGANRLAADHR